MKKQAIISHILYFCDMQNNMSKWLYFLIPAFFCLSGSLCSQGNKYSKVEKSTKMSLRFEIEGFKGGTCQLIGVVGSQNFLADSIVAIEGQPIVYENDSLFFGGLYYLLLPDNKFVQFLLDSDQEFSMKTKLNDLVNGMVVSGSRDNELFYENLKFEDQFSKEIAPINEKVKNATEGTPDSDLAKKEQDQMVEKRKAHISNFKENFPESFFTQFKLAGQNPDLQYPKKADGSLDTATQVYLYRKMYWDNTALTDERLLRTPVIINKLKNYIEKATPQVADSIIKYGDIIIDQSKPCKEMFKFLANWMAINYEKAPMMDREKVFVHLVDKYFTDDLAFWATPKELRAIRDKAKEMRPSLMGNIGQDLTCTNLQGRQESLYDLKGPLTILYIYSYDCSHCKERTPVMVQVYNQWKSKGLQVFALCVEQDESKWRNFVNNFNMGGFHNVFDPKYNSTYYSKYYIDITPEVYVLDKDHKIVSKNLHPDQLEPTLKKYLD